MTKTAKMVNRIPAAPKNEDKETRPLVFENDQLHLKIIQPPNNCLQKIHRSIAYKPLPNSTSIRLLKLHGVFIGNKAVDLFAPLRISMVVRDLNDDLQFHALSCTWGDPLGLYDGPNVPTPEEWAAPAFEVYIDGEVASMATNLYTALLSIR